MTGTTSVPSASPSTNRSTGGLASAPRAPQSHHTGAAPTLDFSCTFPTSASTSEVQQVYPPVSRAPAEGLWPRHTNYETGTAQGCLSSPCKPLISLFHANPRAAGWRKGDMVTLRDGRGMTVQILLLHHQICPSEQPDRVPVFLWRTRSSTEAPHLPTNLT